MGVVLAGIAGGGAAGGHAADRLPPRPLLALLLAGGGLLALLTVPVVRLFGGAFEGSGTASALALTLFALLPSATVLSAVTLAFRALPPGTAAAVAGGAVLLAALAAVSGSR